MPAIAMAAPLARLLALATLLAAASAAIDPLLVNFDKSVQAARSKHKVSPLKWSDTLAADAAAALGPQLNCKNGPLGDGLTNYNDLLTSDQSVTGANAIAAWLAEESTYNYNTAVGSAANSNFTQVVWGASTTYGCVLQACSFWNVACKFSPAGNVAGLFADNVFNPNATTKPGCLAGKTACGSKVANKDILTGCLITTKKGGACIRSADKVWQYCISNTSSVDLFKGDALQTSVSPATKPTSKGPYRLCLDQKISGKPNGKLAAGFLFKGKFTSYLDLVTVNTTLIDSLGSKKGRPWRLQLENTGVIEIQGRGKQLTPKQDWVTLATIP